ncbi:MAG: DUF559 domain-containing protein [Lewinellaceae bacterium]|nr:DUF559 domain-containing protein [Lewinellaceae bacterium]
MPPEAAPLLYRELVKVAAHPHWAPREKVLALAALLERLFFEATRQEQLAFSTLFARISYAGHLFQIQPDTLQRIHHFRRIAGRVRSGQEQNLEDRHLRLGVQALAETVLIFCKTAIPPDVLEHFPAKGEWQFAAPEIWDYKARARVVAVRDEPEQHFFFAFDEENPFEPVRVRYNLPERNDSFNPTIRLLRTVFGFPVTLNLLDVDVDQQGFYRPRAFVVEPDFLMDVSAISECFKVAGAQPLAYLVKKFLPYEQTPPILLGNIANLFLDRLLTQPGADYTDLLRESFQAYPFVFAPMPDGKVREILGKAQKHYLNLKYMAQSGFAQQQIDPADCVLEPTFYSEQFGLQGRLDLFFRQDDRSAIVELKSGTPYRPNAYGIQRSHFTQTLLYDLLVRSVYGAQSDPAKYILYSGMDVQQLRFAPTVAPEQWEALQVRNHLVGIERLLAAIRPGDLDIPLLQRLRADKAPKGDFLQRDFGQFEAAYGKLNPLEKKYFNAFCGLIAREQWLAKVGEENSDTVNGNAALWRSSFAEKQEAYAILSHLKIVKNQADQADPCIVFQKTEKTNPLANFRVGDIAVLYPAETETDTVLDHQVIKCIITELGANQVVVQLRYRQFNLKPFETSALWNLEPDMLDMGFTAMYRGLFEWAGAGSALRTRVLDPGPTPNPSPRGEGDTISGGKVGAFGKPHKTSEDRWRYLKAFVKGLRKSQTKAEEILWQQLRNKQLDGIKFRRQHAIENFIADFVSLEFRLVIEIDGSIHNFQPEWDELRTEYLEILGFKVIRFSNAEVLNQLPETLNSIRKAVKSRQKEFGSLAEDKNKHHNQAPLPPGDGVGPSPPPLGEGMGVGLTKIAQSQNFFLLWGPPGTGKTSIMLRDLAGWVLGETTDNLLLLAYTNRAVDEICEALDSLGGNIREQYLRIGSRFSTAERFRDQLLSAHTVNAGNRAELLAILEPRRIIVSTVASFAHNENLLAIKKIQRLVVDEASQILEPQLVGLLTRFEHFVLIGDHRQLPAVTAQAPELTRVDDPDLNGIGLYDLRDSYFERLYRLCQQHGLEEHYGQLYRQGRMHADIMDFPNRYFYDGQLQTLAGDDPEHTHKQHLPLLESKVDLPEPWRAALKQRVAFIPVRAVNALPYQKTAPEEARLVAELLHYFKNRWAAEGKPWDPETSLGIITPWRAQIAQIRQAISEAGLDPDAQTIDTVERYQGGAREVILISCCVHAGSQLAKLVNLSNEGIDRKLNVALTRAREQVIVIGNPDVLQEDERYQAFIDLYNAV